MFELICAVDYNYAIGKDGTLPWSCKDDLKHFKQLTYNSTLIFGRKTCEKLPYLQDRNIICLTEDKDLDISHWENKYNTTIVNCLNDILKLYDQSVRYFVAGGASIYSLFLSNRLCSRIHMSYIKCHAIEGVDTYFNRTFLSDFTNVFTTFLDDTSKSFVYCRLEYSDTGRTHEECQYLNIASSILQTDDRRKCRNAMTLSSFVNHMKFDLRTGFPLLTTKKMFLRGIIEELLFFIRGETDTKLLSEKKIKIWEKNTSNLFLREQGLKWSEGMMGPMYGYQWRTYNKPYNSTDNDTVEYIDQLNNVIKLINTDPMSRRILLTSYNPLQCDQGVLYPCHSIVIQFFVDGEYLDLFCYNRSQDLFLGVPYNIASTSILLELISKVTGKKARYVNITMGDTHIYENHIEQMTLQCKRKPLNKPILKINKDLKSILDIEKLKFEDFELSMYNSYPVINAEMVA